MKEAKIERQPKQIPREAGNPEEQGGRVNEVIKVIRLVPITLDYFDEQGVPHMNLLFQGVRKVLPAELDKTFQQSSLKFPVQVQTCLKIRFHRVRNGVDEYIIKNIRADDISNATYTANNREGFIKVVLSQLRDFFEGPIYQFQEEGSDWGFDEITSFHIR
jgi:hypothetical protein